MYKKRSVYILNIGNFICINEKSGKRSVFRRWKNAEKAGFIVTKELTSDELLHSFPLYEEEDEGSDQWCDLIASPDQYNRESCFVS